MDSLSKLVGYYYRSLWERIYTDLSWAYDIVALVSSLGMWYRLMFVACDYIREGPVLEVGFGRGRLLRRLAKLSDHFIVGIDYSAQMAGYTRGKLKAAGFNAHVIQGDGQALPFKDNTFGTLVTVFATDYIAKEETQKEFARVLRPGGSWVWVDAPGFLIATDFFLKRAVSMWVTEQQTAVSWPPPIYLSREFTYKVEQVRVGPAYVYVTLLQKNVTPVVSLAVEEPKRELETKELELVGTLS